MIASLQMNAANERSHGQLNVKLSRRELGTDSIVPISFHRATHACVPTAQKERCGRDLPIAAEPGIHNRDPEYGIRPAPYGVSPNDERRK
jgi:hypothetical protein